MPNHTWIESDDLMILFIYKFGIERSHITKQEIANKIGVTLGSVSYRIGNFKAIDGIGSATHVASLSRIVHEKYSALTEQELKISAFSIN